MAADLDLCRVVDKCRPTLPACPLTSVIPMHRAFKSQRALMASSAACGWSAWLAPARAVSNCHAKVTRAQYSE